MCSINHDLKAIYIHIPKCGGVYVEHILKKYYGFKLDYFIKGDNYGFYDANQLPCIDYEKYGVLRYYINSSYIADKYNMNIEKWNSYYKFTFVRNPYSRIISAYEYLKQKYNDDEKFPSFEQFIKIQKEGFKSELYKNNSYLYYYHYYHTFITQTDHLTDNNNVLNINYIGNYENINGELIKILKEIGVEDCCKHINEINNNLMLNTSIKQKNYNYFTQPLLEYFNIYFHNDFINFNYNKIKHISGINDINIDTNTIITHNNINLLKKLQYNQIQIYDNYLDCFDIAILKNIIDSNNWEYGHKSSLNEMDNSFLFMNLRNNIFCSIYLKHLIEVKINSKITIDRLYAIGQFYGQDGSFHIDNNNNNAYTCCIYISKINVPYSNMYVGGNLLIKEPNKKYITCIEPLYNRAVIFQSNLNHVGLSYSKNINTLRVCVVIKFCINI